MWFPQYELDEDGPFLMAISETFFMKSRGLIVHGMILRGKVQLGDSVDIVGLQENKETAVVRGREYLRFEDMQAERAFHRDNVAVLMIGDIEPDLVKPGMVIGAPGTMMPSDGFKAEVAVLPTELGGRKTPFTTGYNPKLALFGHEYECRLTLPEAVDEAHPGDHLNVDIELDVLIPIARGIQIVIKERHKVVGVGIVVEPTLTSSSG